MKIEKILSVMALSAAFFAGNVAMADVPPPPPPHAPHGVHLRPGMMWCSHCEGRGTHGRYWYGFRKPCHKCGGSGMVPAPHPPHHPHPGAHHPAPPPPPAVKRPAPPPPPKRPVPPPPPAPKGGPRR
ncbi:MAG: hypothetical protein MJ240_00320 [Kiritimatiellae bacterium]|nr:hypothetical protein [Kiritimatiellia bacterium]